MPQRPTADRTAKLLLWSQKEQARFHADPRGEAPVLDAETVLKLALGRHVEFSDPALKRVSAATLRAAAAARIRQFHFRTDATLYQVLGVTPNATEQEIKEAFRFLMQLIHPDRQGARREWPDAFAARANHAYAILRNVDSRAKFDREETERAARARVAQGAAAVAAAPQAAHWPKPGRVTRRPPPAALPEWLTAGVGGFARAHPAVVAFGMLIGIAVLVIGSVAWERDGARLAREMRNPTPSSLPDPLHASAVPAVTAPEPASDTPVNVDMPTPARTLAPAPEAGAGARLAARPAEGARMTGTPERSAPEPDLRMAQREEPATIAPKPAAVSVVINQAPALPESAITPPVLPDAAPVRIVAAPAPMLSASTVQAPKADEIETLFMAYVDSYNRGRLDAFAALFDDAAQTSQTQGRAAIRREYGDLFQRSERRRMTVSRMSWKPSSEVAQISADAAVRILWRDGRESEERLTLDMDLARRDGRVVIIRLSQQAGAP